MMHAIILISKRIILNVLFMYENILNNKIKWCVLYKYINLFTSCNVQSSF